MCNANKVDITCVLKVLVPSDAMSPAADDQAAALRPNRRRRAPAYDPFG